MSATVAQASEAAVVLIGSISPEIIAQRNVGHPNFRFTTTRGRYAIPITHSDLRS
jgi:hypothetical protein